MQSRRGAEWVNTLNEENPIDGGYLVPSPMSDAITVYREQVGAMRRLARVVPMTSDTYTFVKQTSGTTVYYPGEEGTITASDLEFSKVSLIAKKRAILSYISNELRDDALVSVVDMLTQDMGHQFALKEDQEGIAGDATSSYGLVHGIRPKVIAATASVVAGATNNDTWPEITYGDLAKAMANISDKFRSMPLSWLCSAAFKWQVFDRLALAQGGALSQSMVDGVMVERFAGYPVIVSDRMPTTTAAATVCAIFGAFGNAVILGDRNDIRIATSEHIAFTTDQIAVRATTRYDINVHEAGDTATAGALVGFKTAA